VAPSKPPPPTTFSVVNHYVGSLDYSNKITYITGVGGSSGVMDMVINTTLSAEECLRRLRGLHEGWYPGSAAYTVRLKGESFYLRKRRPYRQYLASTFNGAVLSSNNATSIQGNLQIGLPVISEVLIVAAVFFFVFCIWSYTHYYPAVSYILLFVLTIVAVFTAIYQYNILTKKDEDSMINFLTSLFN
jgi:hypothetical protein